MSFSEKIGTIGNVVKVTHVKGWAVCIDITTGVRRKVICMFTIITTITTITTITIKAISTTLTDHGGIRTPPRGKSFPRIFPRCLHGLRQVEGDHQGSEGEKVGQV